MRDVEYGRFGDPARVYVITSGALPDTIRVFNGEPIEAEMVCTISNLSIRPITSWAATYYSNMPNWKRRLEDEAVGLYRRAIRDRTLADIAGGDAATRGPY